MSKNFIVKIFSLEYIFPFFIGVYGILNVLYAEKLPANGGLGWDGYKYAIIAKDFLKSQAIDNYTIMRIFPSALVHIVFKMFQVAFTINSIIIGFEIINVISLVITAIFLKKIFQHFDITLKNQILGFLLLFGNYANAKFAFYYPVMTDSAALCLSTMLLYFYLKNRTINLLLISLIAGFTWPIIFYQGVLMFVFPLVHQFFQPFTKVKTILFHAFSAHLALLAIFYFVYINYQFKPMLLTLPLDFDIIVYSIFSVVLMYYFFPSMLMNKLFFSKVYLKKVIDVKRVLLAVIILIGFNLLIRYLNYKGSQGLLSSNLLSDRLLYSLVKPFITIVAHTNYFGGIVLLVIIFWKRFSITVSEYGLGIVLAFMLNFYFFAEFPESRTIINLLPWLVVFVLKAIDQLNFNKFFYTVILVFNLLSSKMWLMINYADVPVFNSDNTIGFPNQKFFMNWGPWMSVDMWKLQTIVVAFTLVVLLLILYRLDFKKGLIYSRFNNKKLE